MVIGVGDEMKNIIVVVSDDRQLYVSKYFSDRGYSCRLMKDKDDFSSADAVVLPIPSEDGGKIRSTGVSYSEFAEMLRENCAVFGFLTKNGELEKELKGRNICCFDVYESGELALLNSRATAQGVLGYILNDGKKLLCETRILLSGYGRTGKAILETLRSNGAAVDVLARREEYRAELRRKGVSCFSYLETPGGRYDYLINTVAAKVVDEHILKTLDDGGKILEIASKPYGVDFQKAEEMGLEYEILPSLPSKAAPESAGIFMAKAVEKLIEKNVEEGKSWKN